MINDPSLIGRKFRTISRAEVFVVVEAYLAAGSIQTIKGRSSKHETTARFIDVVFLQPWEMDFVADLNGDGTGILVKHTDVAVAYLSRPFVGAKWHVRLFHAWGSRPNASFPSKKRALEYIQDQIACWYALDAAGYSASQAA